MKIVIEYENLVSEYIHAYRVYYSRGILSKIDKVVAVLLALAGIYTFLGGEYCYAVLFLALAPLEWFDLLSLQPLQARLRFAMEPKFKERYHVEFDDSGLDFKTAAVDSHLDWSFYKEFIESRSIFLLVYGKMMYSVIPKRAFASDAEIDDFRAMLKRNISPEHR